MLVYVSHPNTGEEDKKIVEDFIKEKQKKYKDVTFISPIHTLDWQYDGDKDYVKKMNDHVELLEKCDVIVMKTLKDVMHYPECLLEAGYAKGKAISFVLWDEFDKYMKRFDDDDDFEDDED